MFGFRGYCFEIVGDILEYGKIQGETLEVFEKIQGYYGINPKLQYGKAIKDKTRVSLKGEQYQRDLLLPLSMKVLGLCNFYYWYKLKKYLQCDNHSPPRVVVLWDGTHTGEAFQRFWHPFMA